MSAAPRLILVADLLAVGSELTAGETRDTNGGELARWLTGAGITVRRIAALPDDLAAVSAAIVEGLAAADMVVTTGGLGPTPDDLTREAIAAATGEMPSVDPALEAWLRDLFVRRGLPFPEANRKQAWLIPSATALPNPNGTAPGWWVDRSDGRVVVALPGPPREMRPMWAAEVLPRLRSRGVGDDRVVRTLRTTGIGESLVVERLGPAMFAATNPAVATYARSDAVDVRIVAVAERDQHGQEIRPAAALADELATAIRSALPGRVWAEGETSWGELIAERATRRGVTIALVEGGTRGALGALLADVPALRRAVAIGPDEAAAALADRLRAAASEIAAEAGATVGLALAAVPDGRDTRVRVAVVGAAGTRTAIRRVFLGGPQGRLRAAIVGASLLAEVLEGEPRAAARSATPSSTPEAPARRAPEATIQQEGSR